MYKISEFAKLCNSTSKTIRFYDNVNLLKADYTDSNNGYRYYGTDKILQYYKISALKEIGMTLKEIKEHFMSSSDDEIIELLDKKERQLLSAHEKCKKLKSEYEERLKMKNERQNNVVLNCDHEKNIISINAVTEIHCSPENLQACYEVLNELLNCPGFVNIDVSDLYELNKSAQPVEFAYGTAAGTAKEEAVFKLVADTVKNSDNILVSIQISYGASLDNIDKIMCMISDAAPKEACIKWGTSFNYNVDDFIGVSVIGFC